MLLMSSVLMSEAGPSKPRLRANKACENCRLRKTRCSGVTPCEPCKNAGIEGQCFVRNKARPNRLVPFSQLFSHAYSRPAPAILARARVEQSIQPAASSLSYVESSSLQNRAGVNSTAGSYSSPRQNPLDFLKEFVQQWGTENGEWA